MIEQDELARIRARAEKATAGPWHACGDPSNQDEKSLGLGDSLPPARQRKDLCSCGQIWSVPADAPLVRVEGGDWGDRYPSIRVKDDGSLEPYQEMIVYGSIPRESQQANMAFIAHARTDIPAMADSLDEARATLDEQAAKIKELEAALRCFLEDERFQVTVGGNPIVVDRMLASARALIPEKQS